MGWDWLVPLFMALVMGVVFVLKNLYGTDKPQQNTVEHPKPDVEVADGKSDQERLKDLGL